MTTDSTPEKGFCEGCMVPEKLKVFTETIVQVGPMTDPEVKTAFIDLVQVLGSKGVCKAQRPYVESIGDNDVIVYCQHENATPYVEKLSDLLRSDTTLNWATIPFDRVGPEMALDVMRIREEEAGA